MADQENGAAASQSEGSNTLQPPPGLTEVPKPATPSNARTCGVCSVNPAKYKCTTCELPYCSVACNNKHKVTHPVVPEVPKPVATEPETTNTNGSQATARAGTMAAAGKPDVLAPLLTSPDLKKLFEMYPSLRGQLRQIYEASQPPKEENLLQSHVGRLNQGRDWRDKAFWTKEQGTRDGVEALVAAKKIYGKDGDGVREFAELVVKLVSPENAVNGNLERSTVIEREAEDENARMITQLLRGELGGS